ncbi:MAG: GNAT family N-acetyltransferase [Candidatus Korobacteraceae bacterium]
MAIHQQLIGTESEAAWRGFLPANRSVFASLEFARLQEQYLQRLAKLFVFGSDESSILYPFLLRPLSDLPFACESMGAQWDSTTPEFTGPFGLTQASVGQFTCAVHRLWPQLGVVTEFMHLNPWSGAEQLLPAEALQFNRDLVWVDTSLPDDELWRNHFSHACRKNLKRANSENVRVYEATGLDDVHEFHRIYRETMDRNQAFSSYYFPKEYFTSIFETMRQNCRFVMAEYKNRIVAATLYLHDNANVYSYLGGADYDYQAIRPTNVIVFDTITWARSVGKRRLILGGGYQEHDGIFRFKAGFSQLRAAFYTFQQVHLVEQYNALRDGWCRSHEMSGEVKPYFPVYRAPLLQGKSSLTCL